MMKHQKKRNTGLLYEFLVGHVTQCLVEGDQQQARRASRLIRKHMLRKGSELYREFRLFHALVNTTVESEALACRILDQARSSATTYDATRLDREKSLLIRDINHTFCGDGSRDFYSRRVDEYRIYATVQMLLNEWRQPSGADPMRLTEYERAVIDWLMMPKERNVLSESTLDAQSAGSEVDDLVMGLMLKRVNSKYGKALNSDQLRLMQEYVHAKRDGDHTALLELLDVMRQQALDSVDAYLASDGDRSDPSGLVRERLTEVRELLLRPVDVPDDGVLARYLRIAKLHEEICGVDGGTRNG